MNKVTYVATEMFLSPQLHIPCGTSARVYVNGTWQMAIQPQDRYGDHMVPVVIFTGKSNGKTTGAAMVYMPPAIIDVTIVNLSALYPPF